MSAVGPGGGRLGDCLARIAALLEQGEIIAAASLLEELNALTAGPPEAMTEEQLSEVNRALSRCVELEQGLRQKNVEALQRFAATRRCQAYLRPQEALQTRR